MKKQILILAMLLMALVANAQLKVNNIGCVFVGDTTVSTNGQVMKITDKDSKDFLFGLRGDAHVIQTLRNVSINTQNTSYTCGLQIFNSQPSKTSHLGLYVSTENTYVGPHVITYGIKAETAACSSGKSYGMHASLTGIGNGTAIYGSDGNDYVTIDGRYAGVFAGNVKVSGTINGTLLGSSDLRLKQDIKSLDQKENSALDNLNLLTPISYKYNPEKYSGKDVYEEYSTEELEEIRKFNPEEYANIIAQRNKEKNVINPVIEKTHFGLVAQELQNVYPELVYQDDNGYLSVNYIELIPILMQSVKELNAKVEEQSAIISKLTTANEDAQQAKSFSNESTSVESVVQGLASMEQNVPNPFSEKTDISIYLPESVKTAKLCIYDLNGSQISKQEVVGRGDTTMTIHADEMEDGMYIYALIADGKVVTTKKMIVSK